MNKDLNSIYREIFRQANEAGLLASEKISCDNMFCCGFVFIPDARKSFSKWLIKSKLGKKIEGGVAVDSRGGQYYSQANAYTEAFCTVLECFGIKAENEIDFD